MRQLKNYSNADNLEYLKQEYKPIYFCLREMVISATNRFIEYEDKIDANDDFDLLLATLKSALPHGVIFKLRHSDIMHRLEEENPKRLRENLKQLANIFETMFLDRIDRYIFESLDPEIQDLYLEAQKEIDK